MGIKAKLRGGKLKAKVKVPFLFSAKPSGFLKLKKGKKNEKEKK